MGKRFDSIVNKVFGEAKDTMPKPSYTTVRHVESATYDKGSKSWKFTVADDTPDASTGHTRAFKSDGRYTDVYSFETDNQGNFYANRSDMDAQRSNAFRDLQEEIQRDPVVHYERDVYHPMHPKQFDLDRKMDTRRLGERTPRFWRGLGRNRQDDMVLDRNLYNNRRDEGVEIQRRLDADRAQWEEAQRYDVSESYQPGAGGNYDMPAPESPRYEPYPGYEDPYSQEP